MNLTRFCLKVKCYVCELLLHKVIHDPYFMIGLLKEKENKLRYHYIYCINNVKSIITLIEIGYHLK